MTEDKNLAEDFTIEESIKELDLIVQRLESREISLKSVSGEILCQILILSNKLSLCSYGFGNLCQNPSRLLPVCSKYTCPNAGDTVSCLIFHIGKSLI